jgi:anti-anti-sigma factor
MALPGHIDAANAGQVREELLSVIDRGASTLIVDMSATSSCDQTGANAVMRGYQRAMASNAQVRLVVTSPAVRRALGADGLDRLVPIYPSLETAIAASAVTAPTEASPVKAAPDSLSPPTLGGQGQHGPPAAGQHAPGVAALAPSLLWALVDALTDGVALVGDVGVLELVNRRLEEMFGYEHGELAGRPVESLIPADLRAAHRRLRDDYARAPLPRPMGARARLVGLRKDRTTFPVEISLSPVPTATGQLTLAVVRDVTQARRHDDLMQLARAVAAEQVHYSRELFDQTVSDLFEVGLSLEAATHQARDVAGRRINEALHRLDGTIHQIRDHMFGRR